MVILTKPHFFKKLALLIISGFAAPLIASGATNPGKTVRIARQSTEIDLGPVPTAGVIGQPFIDAHGWSYGLVVQTPEGRSLWLNGIYGSVFDDFGEAPITDAGLVFDYAFSPDGKRLAYSVGQGGQWRMVVDGQPEPPEEGVRYPLFSPDNRHLAYVIQRKGKEYVQVDGVLGPECDTVCGPIRFSPDGRRIAYAARRGKEVHMVIDQKERWDWPDAGMPVFSPDSQHVAYMIKGGCAVVDGVKGLELAAETWWGPVFSTDSRHFAYVAGTWSATPIRHSTAFIDGQSLRLPAQGTNVLDVFFSPDLKRWACTFERNGKKEVYVDGQFGRAYDSVYGLQFSGDGSRYAYLGRQGECWWMVVDTKAEAEVSINSSGPRFSPNGRRLAYVAGCGPGWWMMIDGKAGPKFKGRKERRLLSYQEEEVPGLTEPQFSPDSAEVAYAASEGGRWGVWINNRLIGHLYETIIGNGPSFREDGSLEFLGIHKGRLYRIVSKQ